MAKPFLPLIVVALSAAPVCAQEDPWALCEPVPVPALPQQALPADVTYIDADRLDTTQAGITTFSGDVVVKRQERLLTGERATYDRNAEEVTLSGNVTYRTADTVTEGERARLRLEDETGTLEDVRFHFVPAHAYGTAELVEIITPEFTHLEQATYSTCPPRQRDWYLKAGQLELDREHNTGEAYHVWVAFKGVPFFYAPYLNFPLEGRKSGFLAPTFGHSEVEGTEIAVPYYWNIAPNRDATITPHFLQQRGTMLSTEYRYLFRDSAGEVNYDYLPDDDLFGDDRSYERWRHNARPAPGWSTSLVFQEVSDREFFDDFSVAQQDTSQTHLERRLDVVYRTETWSLGTLLQDYQTLTGSEPYQRMPQVLLNLYPLRDTGMLRYDLDAELVRFAHASRDPTGTRIDLKPAVGLSLEEAGWFFNPQLAARYTGYRLDQDEDPRTRTLPIASIDSGLFLEREVSIGGRSLVQTLEPRLFYLYVPYENQQDLPLFDTGIADFTFSQLFRDNRFTGADRQGDANQLTTAITTRLVDNASGEELASASIGQIHYFADRRVTLGTTGDPAETPSSELVGELRVGLPSGWDAASSVRWNPHDETTEVLTARVGYNPSPGRNVSLSYRLRKPETPAEPELEQTDLFFFWPAARHWNVLGRWNYDLLTQHDLDTAFGLEYQSCCWSLRYMYRRTLDTTSLELESSHLVLFELKGLAQLGRGLGDELERSILGYD